MQKYIQIKLNTTFTMSHTAGMTWDFGAVPYVPTPYQWMKRFEGMHLAHRKWNLTGLMDSHHYGWWPSPISQNGVSGVRQLICIKNLRK
ncbi:MAG: hypothetical protein ABFD79_06940 [Phycisphaerales bacterium]